MNRKDFLSIVTFAWLDQKEIKGREDRIVTVGSIIVGETIDIDLYPVDAGPLISISLHAITASSLNLLRREECSKFIQDLLKDKRIKYRYLGTDRSSQLPIIFGDLILPPDDKNLSSELVLRGFASVIPELKSRRPDLAAIQLKRDRSTPLPKTGVFVIARPTDQSLHPSLTACVSAGDVHLDRYARFGTGNENTLGVLICNHRNTSLDNWSLNICYRILKGNTDGHKLLIIGAKTNQIAFWMYYDVATESMVYGAGSKIRGSIRPSYKWQILSYCHEKAGDEVHMDGKLLLQLPSASEACDLMIAPSVPLQKGKNTVTNLQYIEYSDTRLVATRSTIRNLDYDPKPNYADLADRFAQANRLDRTGEVGAITGLGVLQTIRGNTVVSEEGETHRVYATATSGSGKLNVINSGDASFQEGCKSAHAVVKLWCSNRPINPNKFDINLSAGQSGLKISGNSGGAAAATCMISAVSQFFIDSSTAVTGAITLNGNITAVGGIPDKAIAALLDRSVSLIAIPASVAMALRPVFFAAPKLYMAHQIIAVSHIDQLTRQVLLQKVPNGQVRSIDSRVNLSREMIIRGMQFYKTLRFTEATAALSQALTYCPEDMVTGLWIDLIQTEYQRIKREENDF
ncbi:S16 family serine protease [Armatimonas sp.]|uniref:S16 family serine protease n=1 Tax=Armatimonas sp. TaxID=1872638 RepID=UPI003753AC4D